MPQTMSGCTSCRLLMACCALQRMQYMPHSSSQASPSIVEGYCTASLMTTMPCCSLLRGDGDWGTQRLLTLEKENR